jgi:hypothetical protein
MTVGCRKFRNEELRNLPPFLGVVMINNLRKIFRHRRLRKLSNLGYNDEKLVIYTGHLMLMTLLTLTFNDTKI